MTKASASTIIFPAAVCLVIVALFIGTYLSVSASGSSTETASSSSTTSGSEIQGIVVGYVTVGPSKPNCPTNASCGENMSGYSLLFIPECTGTSEICKPLMAEIAPSGHYSILLNPGNYTVTGLYPSCTWVGCAAAFPRAITVVGGMQIVYNFDIDTGIR